MKTTMRYSILFVLFCAVQSVTAQVNADSLFTVARELATREEYDSARTVLAPAVEAYPEYYDLQNYIARTYAWEKRYSEALDAYKVTLKKDSANSEAWIGIGDVYLWQKQYSTVVDQMTMAESKLASDSVGMNEVRIRKGNALFQLRQYRESLDVLNTANGPRARQLRQLALLRLINNSVDVYGSAEFFSDYYDPMHYGTVQVGQSTRHGVGIARINTAQRFDSFGMQGEIDLYPRITDRVYGYVNYGYSPNTNVFPEHRVGAEVYSELGGGFEASIGMRYLYFDPENKVAMYTGSVSYYIGKYWLSIRPFFTPQEDGTDFTGNFTARRFLGDSRSWLTFNFTYGFSPDARRIQVGSGETIEILESTKASLQWQQTISQDWMFIAGFSYTYQELPYAPGTFYSIYTPNLGLKLLL